MYQAKRAAYEQKERAEHPERANKFPQLQEAAIRFEPDVDFVRLEMGYTYSISMDGVATPEASPDTLSLTINPLLVNGEFFEFKDPDALDKVYDLSTILHDKGVTDEQRSNVGFTIQALAKVTGVNIYQEQFYKLDRWSSSSRGPRIKKGTLPQLINAICREWGYRAVKVGDDYFMWSQTWARERSIDIPDRVLLPYQKRLARGEKLTPQDRIQLASQLTWPQVRLTLYAALGQESVPNMLTWYQALRVMARMTSRDRLQLENGGYPVAEMPQVQQDAVIATLLIGNKELTEAQIRRATLAFRQRDGSSSLLLKQEDGTILWGGPIF